MYIKNEKVLKLTKGKGQWTENSLMCVKLVYFME